MWSASRVCVCVCMCVSLYVVMCERVCLCVWVVPWPASCQCAALNPAKKAKPNYRHTATDLAGMLTRTGGRWAGGGGLEGRGQFGKVSAGRPLHKGGPQRPGGGAGGVGHYFRIWCSHYLSSRTSGRGRENKQLLTLHICGKGYSEENPQPNLTPLHPAHTHSHMCAAVCNMFKTSHWREHGSVFKSRLCPPWVPWVSSFCNNRL